MRKQIEDIYSTSSNPMRQAGFASSAKTTARDQSANKSPFPAAFKGVGSGDGEVPASSNPLRAANFSSVGSSAAGPAASFPAQGRNARFELSKGASKKKKGAANADDGLGDDLL